MIEKAIELIKKIKKHGYEAYMVGGCVRDFLMGLSPTDYDIATDATPLDIKKIFKKTIDVGIAHGTIKVKYNDVFFEVTTFRTESGYKDLRRPSSVNFVSSLKKDLNRRDFTINAIALDQNMKVIDPIRGKKDIDSQIIRTVGSPDIRFSEDALRMMRAIRFACKLNFTIEEKTFNGIKNNKNLILNISKERITDELIKAICSNYAHNIKYLFETGLATVLSPNSVPFDYSILNKFELDKNIRLGAFLSLANFNTTSLILSNSQKRTIKLLNSNIKLDEISLKKAMGKYGFNPLLKYLDYYYIKTNEYKYIEAKRKIISINAKNLPLSKKDLAVNGTDLINEGIKKGNKIGKLLNKMTEYVLIHPEANKKDKLLKLFLNKKEDEQ